jgi:hypothetical protein
VEVVKHLAWMCYTHRAEGLVDAKGVWRVSKREGAHVSGNMQALACLGKREGWLSHISVSRTENCNMGSRSRFLE